MQGKSPYIGERSDSNANRYQPPQQSNQVRRTDELLQQILAAQQRLDSMHNHMNVKLNGITNHVGTLERNLEAVTLHVRKLDTQVAQIAEGVKRNTGELPGKPEQNSRGREFVNSVVQNNGESSVQCNTLTAKRQSLREGDVADATTNLENPNCTRGTSSYRGRETSIDREEFMAQQPVTHDLTRRFNETMSLIPRGTTFDEAWERYSIIDAFTNISPKKELVERMYDIMKAENNPYCRDNNWPLTPLKWIEKKNDSGKFSFSCIILGKEFSDCLCDTGSCISIIPKVAADRIGITLYQRSGVSLLMANTYAIPVLGEIRDLLVRIGDHIVRTDFHVIDTQGDQNASIVLGRPFLATVGAVIDLPGKRVAFTHIGPFCIYPAVPTEFSRHEALLDESSESKPMSRRKNDFKGEREATKEKKGIVVKGPDINTQGEPSRTCNSNLESTPPEYSTNKVTIADVNKFGDTGEPTLTQPELEQRGVSRTSEGRSVTATSQPRQS